MEGFQHIQPKCPGQRKAKMVCIGNKCRNTAFLCTDQECVACQNDHLQCRVYPYEALKQYIIDKKCEVKPQVSATVRALQRIFADIAKKMQQLRKQIQNQIQYYGYTKRQAELIKSIKLGQQKEIKGVDMNNVYRSIKEKSSGIPEFSEVKKFFEYKRQQVDFNFSGWHQMLTLPIEPIQIDSTIINSIKQISQFFDIPITSCQLLYRYSNAQNPIDEFHEKCCNDKRDLLILQKNTFGKILGGYTVCGFPNEDRFRFDPTRKGFLFSVSLGEKYPARIDRSITTHYYQQSGPCICYTESNSDMIIMNNGSLQQNHFNLGISYGQQIIANSNQQYERLQNERRQRITGTQQKAYAIQQWQVFQLKFLQPHSIVFNEKYMEHLQEEYIEY